MIELVAGGARVKTDRTRNFYISKLVAIYYRVYQTLGLTLHMHEIIKPS